MKPPVAPPENQLIRVFFIWCNQAKPPPKKKTPAQSLEVMSAVWFLIKLQLCWNFTFLDRFSRLCCDDAAQRIWSSLRTKACWSAEVGPVTRITCDPVKCVFKVLEGGGDGWGGRASDCVLVFVDLPQGIFQWCKLGTKEEKDFFFLKTHTWWTEVAKKPFKLCFSSNPSFIFLVFTTWRVQVKCVRLLPKRTKSMESSPFTAAETLFQQ